MISSTGQYQAITDERRDVADLGGTILHSTASNVSTVAGATGETTEHTYRAVDHVRCLAVESQAGETHAVDPNTGAVITQGQAARALTDLSTGKMVAGEAMSMNQGSVNRHEVWYTDPT